MQQENWRYLLQQSGKNPRSLIEELGLEESSLRLSEIATRTFPFRVPDGFRQRIIRDDPDDPLLRQVLPLAAEDIEHPGYHPDPLAEDSSQPVPGLLHKYSGRALLVVTGACAIHCRYCFRRHFPYAEANPSADRWEKALAYIAADPDITEIILSGGDPLTLPDERLSVLANSLAEIPHLRRLRIHSRIPVVLPERIGTGLIDWLTGTRLQPVMVVHVNHANELDSQAAQAIKKLRDANVPLFNQSVLLKGVNDNTQILVRLSEALFALGIVPYYLHMLDPVAGATHFEVTETRARQIMRELLEHLPGYLVPKLVREIPGQANKIPVELALA